eukprot:gene27857-12034_t
MVHYISKTRMRQMQQKGCVENMGRLSDQLKITSKELIGSKLTAMTAETELLKLRASWLALNGKHDVLTFKANGQEERLIHLKKFEEEYDATNERMTVAEETSKTLTAERIKIMAETEEHREELARSTCKTIRAIATMNPLPFFRIDLQEQRELYKNLTVEMGELKRDHNQKLKDITGLKSKILELEALAKEKISQLKTSQTNLITTNKLLLGAKKELKTA